MKSVAISKIYKLYVQFLKIISGFLSNLRNSEVFLNLRKTTRSEKRLLIIRNLQSEKTIVNKQEEFYLSEGKSLCFVLVIFASMFVTLLGPNLYDCDLCIPDTNAIVI
jgi:hypothetical protein